MGRKKLSEKNETQKSAPKIRPLIGYILIEPSEVETKTSSGILLPENTQERPSQGKVLSVGEPVFLNGKELVPPVKVGDIVIYKKWGSDEIKVQGKEYKLIRFEDLMAVIES